MISLARKCLEGKAIAPVYVNSTIFLFLGGFMIALTMERWGLHRRIALIIIRAIGGGPARIVLGFMAAAAFLSAGAAKLAGAEMMVQTFDGVGLGQWFRYFIQHSSPVLYAVHKKYILEQPAK